MKKQLFLSLLTIVTAAGSIMAQGNMQQKSPSERAKETSLKLKTDLTLTAEQDAKVYKAFEDLYTAQQKAMEEMRNSGSMDREKMKETRDKLNIERDTKLKGILTEDQMKKWTNDIEPNMRPQRRAPAGN
jgi:Spy/CpxP family protein refolding chaperone